MYSYSELHIHNKVNIKCQECQILLTFIMSTILDPYNMLMVIKFVTHFYS